MSNLSPTCFRGKTLSMTEWNISFLSKRAFSLVELSIVLVILGLLVGGVLSGQSLIKAASLRSVMTEHDKYVAAINSFKDKYFALPGDMPNATQFWGAADVNPSNCNYVEGTGTQTCDGNGDGIIAITLEGDHSLKHLSNAGLIEGSLKVYQPPTAQVSYRIATKYDGISDWRFRNVGTMTNSIYDFPGDYGNSLIIINQASTNVFSPEEAWNIDTKMDDGLPGTGNQVSNKDGDGGPDNCTSVGGTLTVDGATYSLQNSDRLCYLYFRNVAG